MTTPTVAEMLKYANLQVAAEALYNFNAKRDPNQTPGSTTNSSGHYTGLIDPDWLTDGNEHATRFTSMEAAQFAAQWEVADHISNTTTGFSGTLFRNRANPSELVLSIRSTEFVDDVARDCVATNAMEIKAYGWAFGQISDMEAWYAQLKTAGLIPAGAQLNVTGYSLGGHLATAFNLLHQNELNGGQVITFNGAGVGKISTGTLETVIADFRNLRAHPEQIALRFSDTRLGELYGLLRTRLGDGHAPTAADYALLDGLSPMVGATDYDKERFAKETAFLRLAMDNIVVLKGEVARLQTVTDTKEGSPAGIPDSAIAQESFEYQMAVQWAKEATYAMSTPAGAWNTVFGKDYNDPRLLNQYDVVGRGTTSLQTAMVSDSQWHHGTNIDLFIEDQPLVRGSVIKETFGVFVQTGALTPIDQYTQNNFGDTHSLTLIVDSLAVQNAVLNLLPADQRNTETTRNALQQILKSASSFKADIVFNGQGRAEGNVLENTLNALGALMLGPEQWNTLRGDPLGNTWSRIDDATHADDDGEWVTFSGREHFYEALDKLLNSETYTSLQGRLTLTPLSAAQAAALKEAAPTDFGAFAALVTLSPFRVGVQSGADLENSLGNAWDKTYSDWQDDKSLSAEARAAGQAKYSDDWYADRSAFLNYWLQSTAANQAVVQDGSLGLNTTDQRIYKQLDSGQKVIVQNSVTGGAEPSDTKENQYYLFGGNKLDILQGGKLADHLYGGSGLDLLSGEQGNDHLEGGTGLDFYRFRTGDGHDVLLDTDRRGVLQRNGQLLVLAYQTGAGQWAGGTGANTWTATRSGDDLILSFADNAEDSLTLKNFDFTAAGTGAGSHGLRLLDPLTRPSETVRTYIGDTRDIDANPEQPGIQSIPDSRGNTLRADGQDGRPLIVEAERFDVFIGTLEPEKFLTGANSDVVHGDGAASASNPEGGADRIELGSGRDTAYAGGGNDWVEGGEGGDILYGNAGNDILWAGDSQDGTLSLQSAIAIGEHSLASGETAELLAGGAGDDTLIGSFAEDLLIGGSGRDLLIGRAGDDNLVGDGSVSSAGDWRAQRSIEAQANGHRAEAHNDTAWRIAA